MALGGNMNVVTGLIGRGVGVAIAGLAIWLKRPQYAKYGLLMAAGAGLAYVIWRLCAG
jgi:hypothetical protein